MYGVGGVLYLQRRIEHLEDAPSGGAGPGDAGGQEAYGEDREEKETQVGVEGDQFADGEAAPDDLQPAEEDYRERTEVGEQEDEREVVRERADGREVLGQKLVVHRAVAGILVVLAGEGPDHAHPRQVLLQNRVQPPERLLHATEEGPDPANEAQKQDEDDRDYR